MRETMGSWTLLVLVALSSGRCVASSPDRAAEAGIPDAVASWERGDADWEGRRDAIVARGPLAARRLAETLFVLAVRQWEGVAGRIPADRARAHATAAELASLGAVSEPVARRALVEGAGAVRLVAEDVFRLRGPAAVASLVEEYAQAEDGIPERRALLRALAACGGDRAAQALLAAARTEPSWELRAAAVEGLARVEAGAAEEGLRDALGDDDRYVRKLAIAGLADRGTSASRGALRQALRRAGDRGDAVEREAIRGALRRIAEREPFGGP